MRVLIVVTHLLGTGHLSRALTLGRAFATQGHDVTVASGGMPAPQLDSTGVRVCQIRPLRSDGTNFTHLLTDANDTAGDAYLNARREHLLTLLAETQPDILITELFPFGRRSLSAEFEAVLEATHDLPARPAILCSIRDILAPPSKPKKVADVEALLDRYFDAVLVHSDPAQVTLDQSWPVSKTLAPMLRYTGYVAPAPSGPHPDAVGSGEILVAAGGGEVGTPIFEAAISAAQRRPDLNWRLLVGGGTQRRDALRARPMPENVVIEAPRPDYRQMLYHASASVSMCGYNTTLDVLQSGVPAVLVPFDDGNEVEQTLRARSLARLPAMTVLPSIDLTPDALLSSVAQVTKDTSRVVQASSFDGAAESVRVAVQLAEART